MIKKKFSYEPKEEVVIRREYGCVGCGRKMISYKPKFTLKCNTCSSDKGRIHSPYPIKDSNEG